MNATMAAAFDLISSPIYSFSDPNNLSNRPDFVAGAGISFIDGNAGGSSVVDEDPALASARAKVEAGIITDADLSRKVVAKGLDPNTTIVSACMSKSFVTIEEDEPLSDAMALMKKQGIRHLPVTADSTVIGVLSVSDLVRAFSDQETA